MRKLSVGLIGIIVSASFLIGRSLPVRADATLADHVVISEVQTGTTASASQEFIELYNPTSNDIALDGWHIQYRPATPTSSWADRTSAGLVGSIPADGFYLVAPTSYLTTADANLTTGMAAGGGSIRLVDGAGNVIDLLGWGTSVESEGSPASAAAAGQSLERLPGQFNTDGGNGLDSDNNSADFILRDAPEPQSTASPLESPATTFDSSGGGTTGTGGDQTGPGDPSDATYAPVVINELLIDPASPQTDAADEFIELYNPTGQTADLAGYVLKTGSNFHDNYTLPDTTITPNGYVVLYSSQTKLALTNSGGAVQLYDPAANLIDQTDEYEQAVTGDSFSRFDSGWAWSARLTPGAANILDSPADAAAAKAAATKAKKATATKAKAIKTTKVKSPKAAKSTSEPLVADTSTGGLGGRWLLIGLVTLTIGYAIYEFRYDLQNYLILARRKFAAWRTHRRSAPGG